MPVKGTYLAVSGIGAILFWSGLKGKSWSSVLRNVISGQNPASATSSNPVSGFTSQDAAGTATVPGAPAGSAANEVSTGSNQQILQNTAAQFGWTGAQWTCLYNVEMAEAGFNANATNPQSGAYGMAQALGHGTANTVGATGVNEYGGYGLTDAQAKAANSGDPGAQALWMCYYVRDTYQNPCNAWAHEQANHWY